MNYLLHKCSLLLQRGSDELLSQSGAVSNGASMSPQPHHAADNNNDAKKVSVFLLIINIKSTGELISAR